MSLNPEQVCIDPPVFMSTARNPGAKTLEGTNTYVVGHDSAFVVDPGPRDPVYIAAIAQWIQANGVSPEGILLTHSHPDHAPGAEDLAVLLQLPIWMASAPPRTSSHAAEYRSLSPGTSFPVDEDTIRVIPTPGHTPDSVAFWIERARILLAGDTVLGRGSSLIAPPDGDMSLYLQSLQALLHLRPTLIGPGHGPLIHDAPAKLEEYIRHRHIRETQILAALREHADTIEGLVTRVYSDTDPQLHRLAAGSVMAHLQMLEQEGKVHRHGSAYQLAPETMQH